MISREVVIGGATDQSRRAIVAGAIGNVLEWYDFAVYGYFVPVISQLFFPAKTPLVSLLLTFSVFGVGFVMRPVGSIVFGQYGDRHGRKRALSAVIFLMAISTFVVGLLPTYASVGALAPALLVLARLAQGLSGGGEWGALQPIWWSSRRPGGAASPDRGSRSASAPAFYLAR